MAESGVLNMTSPRKNLGPIHIVSTPSQFHLPLNRAARSKRKGQASGTQPGPNLGGR